MLGCSRVVLWLFPCPFFGCLWAAFCGLLFSGVFLPVRGALRTGGCLAGCCMRVVGVAVLPGLRLVLAVRRPAGCWAFFRRLG